MSDAAHVVLDANILLHFQPPDQIDWPALTGARRVFLVVYPLLRKELSKAKDMHPNKRIRKRAGEREAWLRERLSNMDEPIRPGVFLFRDAKEPRALIEQLGLAKEVSDDLIVAHAVSLRDGGRQVFVVTADGGLEMKLEDQAVPVLVLDDALRLASEPDPDKARVIELERENKALRNRLPVLEVVPLGACLVLRQEGHGTVDDYVAKSLQAAEEAYREQQLLRAPIRYQGYDRMRLASIFDAQHKTHLDLARQFLWEQHRWVCITEGAAAFRIQVRNSGTLTATEVRVRLFSPSGIVMYGRGGFGVQPRRLAHPDVFSGVPVGPDRDDLAFYHPFGEAAGQPKVDRAKGMAEFTWPRIQQDAAVASGELWLTADAAMRLGPASLRCDVLCEEIGGAQSTHLELRIADR